MTMVASVVAAGGPTCGDSPVDRGIGLASAASCAKIDV
jgi:hypothetical protein